MKGIIEFDSTTNQLEKNVLTYRNIVSPFARFSAITNKGARAKSYVDENYGLVYDDYYLQGETAIYGQTELLPAYSGDQLANYGFLRVPFRKIPRILVHNRAELLNILSSIESRDNNLVLLYRGQFSEHLLDRGTDTNKALYGTEDALEPSLVTSAARKGLRLEDILPSWMPIINLYIENILEELPDSVFKRVEREIRNFQCSSNFNGFALALAQHYGLPSVGLDVTPDIDVALFFALRKFERIGASHRYHYLDIKPEKPPVIYIMAPAESQQLNYADFKPKVMPLLRPDRQSARFMHTGWGLNKNFAATRIFMAIYLDPEGDYGAIKSPLELFPQKDSFAQWINFFKENPRHRDDLLAKFLETFYLVE